MGFDYTTIIPLYDSSGDVIPANQGTFTHLTRDIILELREDVDSLGVDLSITGSNWTSNKFNWVKGTTIALDTDKRHWLSYITDLRTASSELWTQAGLSGSPTWTIATASLKPLYDSGGVVIPARQADYTDVRLKSLYEDVRGALNDIADTQYIFVDAVNGNDTTGDGTSGNPYKTWDKAADIVNASGGNIWLFPGVYTVGSGKHITHNDVLVIGTSAYTVQIKVPSTRNLAKDCDNFQLRNVAVGDSENAQGQRLYNCTNLDIKYCLFKAMAGSTNIMLFLSGTFDHCTFMTAGGSSSYALQYGGGTGITVNNSIFSNAQYGIFVSATSNATINYCGFDTITTKTSGPVTNNNEVISTTQPDILFISTGFINDISDFVDAGSDGFDLGAYLSGPLNVPRTASDSITASESSVMAVTGFASDTVHAIEDITTSNMNLSIDMLLGGLFFSQFTGEVTYLTSSEITVPTYMPDLTYNGATIDMSWDNTGGELCDVYIVVDDGVTDYSPPSWWVINADYPAISTADINGTRGYGIDLTLNGETDDEWGDHGDFTTVTADGVNNKQWDIGLKVRVHNTIKDEWSEVVSISKTYNFNDFDKSMYYCADNPRTVDGEYADHANYYANIYHTGTNKYTRPDGVDWSADNRRYAFNPMFRMGQMLNELYSWLHESSSNGWSAYLLWQNRKSGTIQPLGTNYAESITGLFAPIFVNYGNWNAGGAHCFASPSTVQPYDAGTANFTSPVLSSSTSDIRYLHLQGYAGSDCDIHSSNTGFIIRTPDGENWVRQGHVGKPALLLDSDIYYIQADSPYVACDDNYYYLFVKHNTESYPGDYVAWWFTRQSMYVNTDSDGNLSYGELAPRKVHTGSDSFGSSW